MLLQHKHSDYTPTLAGAAKRVADNNPNREWLFIQHCGLAGTKVSISLGEPDHVCAVLPTQYSSFEINKDNPWDGEVWIDADVDGANLVYVMEISRV